MTRFTPRQAWERVKLKHGLAILISCVVDESFAMGGQSSRQNHTQVRRSSKLFLHTRIRRATLIFAASAIFRKVAPAEDGCPYSYIKLKGGNTKYVVVPAGSMLCTECHKNQWKTISGLLVPDQVTRSPLMHSAVGLVISYLQNSHLSLSLLPFLATALASKPLLLIHISLSSGLTSFAFHAKTL